MSKGSQGFASTYFISGLRTPLWEQVLEYHIKKDMMYYSGSVPKHTLNVVTAEFGLGYDAVLLFATAMNSIINNGLTVTGPALAAEIRNVSIITQIFFLCLAEWKHLVELAAIFVTPALAR